MSESDAKNVGYKNPPKHAQFPPGTSGNPGGRPKDRLSHATLQKFFEKILLNTHVTVKQGNKTSEECTLYGLISLLVNIAKKGDRRAINDVLRHAERWTVSDPIADMLNEDGMGDYFVDSPLSEEPDG